MSDAGTRDGFSFYGGHPALDLCATLRGRSKPTPHDLLATSADLDRWFKAAGGAHATARAGPDELIAARKLREAIYAIALARMTGEPPPASARGALNRLACDAPPTVRLSADGQAQIAGNAQALLASLAQDAVRLLGGADAHRIRQCEAETCTRLFVDLSRSGDRRWCSMTSCGNRAKVAEFRRRARKS
jgi:predicted RNA-binding Zn ribbon-like protein